MAWWELEENDECEESAKKAPYWQESERPVPEQLKRAGFLNLLQAHLCGLPMQEYVSTLNRQKGEEGRKYRERDIRSQPDHKLVEAKDEGDHETENHVKAVERRAADEHSNEDCCSQA